MLKGNLSTRPFYNERLVGLALVGLVVLAAAATFFNARALIALSNDRAALRGRVEQDRAEAARINGETQAQQQSVDRATLRLMAASTHEANDLIAQRTFSWTAFFGLIERTLPFDVRLVAVSPRADRGQFRVQMQVIARDLDDIDAFTAALLGTGAFKDVVPTEQRSRPEDGTYGALLEALYFPPPAGAAPSGPAAPAKDVRP
jgi:hypothetical protein